MMNGADSGRIDLFGERIRDARSIRRIPSKVLAEKVGIRPDRLTRLERSIATSAPPILVKRFGSALLFPWQFFANMPTTVVTRESLLFRAKRSMRLRDQEELAAWARVTGDVLDACRNNVSIPSLRVPRVAPESGPEIAAQQTRAVLGLDHDQPIDHLTRLLERSGIVVACLEFDTELHAGRHHDAFSTWVGRTIEQALVVIRAVDSWERLRMSMAHELGHLAMHQVRLTGDLEREAFAFAAEFLFPAHVLRDEWPGKVTVSSLLPMKRRWGISLAALIEHGFRNGLLTPDRRVSLYKQLSNRRDRFTGVRWREQEPGWRDRDPERPKLLGKIIEKAFDNEQSLQRLYVHLHYWPEDILADLVRHQHTPWAQATARQPDELVELARVVPLTARIPRG